VRNRRDVAIERTRSITKTIGVASIAAVAAFAIYVSRALPGHASTPAGSTANASVGSSPAVQGGSGDQSSSNLAPPSSAPTQSQQQAPVVSGSS